MNAGLLMFLKLLNTIMQKISFNRVCLPIQSGLLTHSIGFAYNIIGTFMLRLKSLIYILDLIVGISGNAHEKIRFSCEVERFN